MTGDTWQYREEESNTKGWSDIKTWHETSGNEEKKKSRK
jgi:hypothetical protein